MLPRPGVFAALTGGAAALALALYYGPGLSGLSYFVGMALVPSLAIAGVLRTSVRGSDPQGRTSAPGGTTRARWIVAIALPVGLLVDIGLRLAVQDRGGLLWLPLPYLLILAAGACVWGIARRRASSRATLAALGIASAAIGVATLPVAFLVGPALATAPLLLLASLVQPHTGRRGSAPVGSRLPGGSAIRR